MANNSEVKELKQNNTFISNTYKKALWPCMLTILSANINVIVDGILIGQKLGSNALAAINLCLPISLFLCVVGSFFSAGTSINSSKNIGKNQFVKANEYYKADIVLSFISSIIITILGCIFINQVCSFLCSDVNVFAYVKEYALITILGSVFKIIVYAPLWYLRLDGKNKEITKMMTVLTVGNIILDLLFVFVLNLGVFGAGLANVLATMASLIVGVYYIRQNDSSFRFSFKIDIKSISIKRIALDGLPSSVNNLCSTIRFLIINSLFMSIGGAALVAVFTAVNGLFSVGECIILGIPQASTAMFGVYAGEKDYDSCKLIIKFEVIIGAILSASFVILSILLAPLLGRIYGLNDNLFMPVFFMAISIFPSLICSVLSSYYNVSGKNIISIIVIISRLVVMTYLGIVCALVLNLNVFTFFIFAEVSTLVFIYIITFVYSKIIHKNVDQLLLIKHREILNGTVINFSVKNSNEEICKTCELLKDFCENNGLSINKSMKLQLAIEEALVLISKVNNDEHMVFDGFDIRAFFYEDLAGLRIRYDGLDFNPFSGQMNTSDYLGIKMIVDMLDDSTYCRTFGVNTLILLLKEKLGEE